MPNSPAIAAYVGKQNEYNTRTGAAIDGIVGDIGGLNALITTLQNSAGQITDEDQATLDQLQAAGEALASKAEALDAMNPPPAPPPTA